MCEDHNFLLSSKLHKQPLIVFPSEKKPMFYGMSNKFRIPGRPLLWCSTQGALYLSDTGVNTFDFTYSGGRK